VLPGGYWVSPYLPVNSAILALFGMLGAPALANAFWSGAAIVLVYAIARQYWPERRDAALVSASLAAASTQLIVNGMSLYAMPAQLAFNLTWLWLFLRKDWSSQIAAAAVAFAACGLHQLIFNPLFAAPFIVQLWLQRRWRFAAFHTIAYAAICLFWVSYHALVLRAQGLALNVSGGATAGGFARETLGLFSDNRPGDAGLMAENLLRFVAWQSPLAIALGLVGGAAARRRSGDPRMRPLIAGLVLAVVAMLVILPFQGHGWGYRYLHGFVGSVCLLAAYAWVEMVKPGDQPACARAWGALAASLAFSVVFMLPLQSFQVFDFIRPYAMASAEIGRAPADVVIVDPTGLRYGQDLVRNDPFLTNRPKVMHIAALTEGQVRDQCARYRIAVFDRTVAPAFGSPGDPDPADPHSLRLRRLMRELSCGQMISLR
jgi:hypothetical protein